MRKSTTRSDANAKIGRSARQDCKKKKKENYTHTPKLPRFSPRRDSERKAGAARGPASLRLCKRQERNRSDVVARKNALQDNCMYVNDGVISLRIIKKIKRERAVSVREKGWE